MKRGYCLLVNVRSNAGKARSIINKYESIILSELHDAEINYVSKGESLAKLAIEKSKQFEVIVACGGDGTARNVASALLNTDSLFGLLPLGTGNDFAKSIGLSKDFLKNLKILSRRETTNVDVVQFNDQQFINTLGIGFDGYTSYLASKSTINGNMKYVLSGLRALSTAKPFEAIIEIKNLSIVADTMMIIIANGSWEGGKYFVSPDSKNNDGITELLLLKKVSKIRLSLEFIKLSFGAKLSSEIIDKYKFTSCSIRTNNKVHIHADGEVIEPSNSVNIQLIKKKVRVIC